MLPNQMERGCTSRAGSSARMPSPSHALVIKSTSSSTPPVSTIAVALALRAAAAPPSPAGPAPRHEAAILSKSAWKSFGSLVPSQQQPSTFKRCQCSTCLLPLLTVPL